MTIIESKRKKPATILKKYPEAILADVTSGAKDGLVKLIPFYPHYGIPVPFSDDFTAARVEAICGPKSISFFIMECDDEQYLFNCES